jgi:vacuolar-type H+-ATPase subunit H
VEAGKIQGDVLISKAQQEAEEIEAKANRRAEQVQRYVDEAANAAHRACVHLTEL